MDESEFSLWPVKNIVQEEGAEYIQTKHEAVLKHADGRIDEYVQHNDLWVLLITIACATMTDKEIEEKMGHTTHNAKTSVTV